MFGKILILTGHLAAGKSTFTRALSSRLCVPAFIKDDVKERLCDCVGFENREQNKRLSVAAVEMMFLAAEALCARGLPVMLEANFHADEAARVTKIAADTGSDLLTFMFTGAAPALYERFQARLNTAERHPAHKSFGFVGFEAFHAYNAELEAFDPGGEVARVDATDFDAVDYAALEERARRFFRQPPVLP